MIRVLVVDDDEQLRKVIKEELTDYGYAVTEAGEGRSALQAVEDFIPHIVVTDIIMPEMEGISFIQELKKRHPHLPVIAFSGARHHKHAFLELAATNGADVVMQKPLDFVLLEKTIRRVMNQGGD